MSSEISVIFKNLTRLIARDDIINVSPLKSFRPYIQLWNLVSQIIVSVFGMRLPRSAFKLKGEREVSN
jgi:hypothetical protein